MKKILIYFVGYNNFILNIPLNVQRHKIPKRNKVGSPTVLRAYTMVIQPHLGY